MTRKRVSDEKTLSWHPYHTRLNFEFELVDGEMVEYLVQLEYNDGSYENPDWKQVARFDSSHGFLHMDIHHTDGSKEKIHRIFPQSYENYEEYRYAKDYLVREEYRLLKRAGYVN